MAENVTMEIQEVEAPTKKQKKNILEDITEKLNVGEKTLKLYLNNLIRLNDGQPIKNLNFLKNPDAIAEKISTYKPNTQRTYYIGIVSVLKENPKFKKQYKIYYDRMMEFNKELRTNKVKSETQKDNWMEQSDVLGRQQALKDSATSLLKKKKLTETEFGTLLDWVVLSLYTLQPPRRNADYQYCFVVKHFEPDLSTDVNYYALDNGTFYLNNYKTKKSYHQQSVEAPPELQETINAYLQFHPLKSHLKKKGGDPVPLLVNAEGHPFTNINSITRILNKIFGKRVGVSLLRNIFLTDKYGEKVSGLEEDASAMGTSPGTIMNNYVKVDGSPEV